jgi:hypothetical protein
VTDLKVIDGKTSETPATSDEHGLQFDRAYSEWMSALAGCECADCATEKCATEEEEETLRGQLSDRLINAEWQLIRRPVNTNVQLKQKFGVLERMICRAEDEGYPTDKRHVFMLASVKVDLWNLWKFRV